MVKVLNELERKIQGELGEEKSDEHQEVEVEDDLHRTCMLGYMYLMPFLFVISKAHKSIFLYLSLPSWFTSFLTASIPPDRSMTS